MMLAYDCRAATKDIDAIFHPPEVVAPFRAGDAADIKLHLRRLGLRTIGEVDAVVADYYGARKLEDGKRWLVEKLLRETRDEKNHPA